MREGQDRVAWLVLLSFCRVTSIVQPCAKKGLAIQGRFCYLFSANDSTPFFALLMVQMLARPVPGNDPQFLVIVLGQHPATRSAKLLRGNKSGALGGRR